MLVSSTERPPITSLGPTSQRPEKYGADILIASQLGIIGVQRKEVADFVASVQDGRLAKEVQQLQHCDIAVIIIEGDWAWSLDGEWMNNYARFTQNAYESMLMSLQSSGIWVRTAYNANETVRVCKGIEAWANKPTHNSLLTRPKPQGSWGAVGHRAYQVHLLQGIEGIGPELAGRIIDHFGGVPLMWACTREQLLEVPGLGKKKVDTMVAALEGEKE